MAKDNFKAILGTGNKRSTLQWVVIAVVVVSVVYFLVQVYKASKTAGGAAGEILGSAIIAQQTGVSVDRQAVCKQVAIDSSTAITFIVFTNYPIWVMDENLVTALNRLVTANEAVLASQFFREKTGVGLLSIINNKGVFTSKNYIKEVVLNALT